MKTIFLNATVLLGLGGLIYLFTLDRVSGVVLLLIVVIYPLPNYLIHVGLRQEYPLEWLMTLLSGTLLVGLVMPKGLVRFLGPRRGPVCTMSKIQERAENLTPSVHANLSYMPSSGLAAREIH